MRFLIIFFAFLLVSCSSNNMVCLDRNAFDVNITSKNLSKINQKQIFNRIVNESNINFDEKSHYVISLDINIRRTVSLVSGNNSTEIENVNFSVNYLLIDKTNRAVVDRGKFIIVDEVDISDNRFATYARDNYITDNFTKNLMVKLENRIRLLLDNRKCKKS